MKIGIDARPLQHETQYRGIGKSLGYLLLALKDELPQEDELLFYLDKGLPKPKLLDNFPNSLTLYTATAKLGRKRYFRSFLPSFKPVSPKKGEVDVLLQYDASSGVPTKVPSVVVFHDLIPYLFRGQEKNRPVKGARKLKDALARNLYWKKYLRVLDTYRNARKIIAISQSSKNDLLKYIPGVKANNVVVISHGANPAPAPVKPSKEVKELASQPFLLYAGGIDIRKNIIGLLEAFFELKLKHHNLRLIMVGKEFGLKQQLEDLGWFSLINKHKAYDKDVILPGFLDDTELLYLYQTAEAFVLPSRYEGFGLPVLEAMSAGCPVIAYDNSSIPEVAGNAALLVKDGEQLAPAIDRLLKDRALRQKLINSGFQRAATFSWAKTAELTLSVLKDAAK